MTLVKKTLKFAFIAIIFVVATSPLIYLSASYALFNFNISNIDTNLDSLQGSNSDITVSLDPSFPYGRGNAPYYIVPSSVCSQYDDDFNCVDPAPDLCPYIYMQPKNEELTENGFTQNKLKIKARGELNNPSIIDEEDPPIGPIDEIDNWTVSIKSPCFEGECPADYDALHNGDPLPQTEKGKIFKCNLDLQAVDESVLVKNFLKNKIAYADIPSNTLQISAVLTGELPKPIRNPVLIIPGVLGTEINGSGGKLWLDLFRNFTDIGDDFMDALKFNDDLNPTNASLTLGDVIRKENIIAGNIQFPLFDYSAGLIQEFENQGYVEGTDLFLFPYDWRYGVSAGNVNELKQKISDILAQSNTDKIDVIAHSTGGLLIKKYVMENSDNHYINKAVFVGVPNTGAPKAIKNLLQGDGNLLVADSAMKRISRNMPVAYDLTPSEQYFKTTGSYIKVVEERFLGYTQRNLNFNESNSFLAVDHRLNVQALINSHHLHTMDFDNYDLRNDGVDLYSINGCKAGTLGKVNEVRYHSFLGDFVSYMSPDQVPGDGTVPLQSATNLPINADNKYFALKGEHAKMLSADGTREQIVNIISGSNLSTGGVVTQEISQCTLSGRAISIYSPLSIDITDQYGNHAGLSSDRVSIENNIPNASFEIFGEHKFAYLPTDDGQIYTINISGTGTGTFTLTDESINENEVTNMQVFKNISVTPDLLGHIELSDSTTLVLDTDADGVADKIIEPNLILSAEEAENFISNDQRVNNNSYNDNPTSGSSVTSSRSSIIASHFLLVETINPVSSENVIPQIPKIIKMNQSKVLAFQPNADNIDSPQKEKLLTANALDSDALFDYKIILMAVGGGLLILLLARNLSKL